MRERRSKRHGSLLKKEQRIFLDLIQRPLRPDDRMRSSPFVNSLIAPNEKLDSLQRLELYARQYWWRVLASLADDFPQLQAALGPQRFRALIERYLVKYPSRSFTLRNLGRDLPSFLARSTVNGMPRRFLSDLAAVEWALIESFDAADEEGVSLRDLQGDAGRLILSRASHVKLVAVKYPIAGLFESAARRDVRGDASNLVSKPGAPGIVRRASRQRTHQLRREHTLLVYRLNHSVYLKALSDPFAILLSLFDGQRPLSVVLQRFSRAVSSVDEAEMGDCFRQVTGLALLTAAGSRRR